MSTSQEMRQEEFHFLRIINVMERLDQYASFLTGGFPVFGRNSLPRPERFVPAELAFIRTVSWLYAMYIDLGKPSVRYLSGKFRDFDLNDEKLIYHMNIVHHLRTFLQHHVDFGKERKDGMHERCSQWIRSNCGLSMPMEEEHWRSCLLGLLKEAWEFLNALFESMQRLDTDESRVVHIKEWTRKVQNFHPPEDFDRILQIAAADMGRDHINFTKLRKRYYETWVKELEKLYEYDFEKEARKLAEHAILTDGIAALPITGEDIKDYFNIPPGKLVGELLEEARILWLNNPCTAEELLLRLKIKCNDMQ